MASDPQPPSAGAPALPITISDIEAARRTIGASVLNTDFDHSRTLSELAGAEIWLKFENLQFTASFKERGALNRLTALTAAERKAGVIAMSAGNHAQGVAYHARRLGIAATIVMPEGTPFVKVDNTRRHGAEVILSGTTLDEAATFARALERERGLTFIHPYDDPLIIAGQGTLGLEMLEAVPRLDCLVVPVGGGGLISGIAVAAKALKPAIEIVGVEAELYPSMLNRITGRDLPCRGDTLAEGIAVKSPGRLTEQVIRALVSDILLVNEIELERAVALLIEIEKTVVEGAGAAGLAAVLASPERFRGRTIGLVLAGGNIDTRLLAGVLTRELARAGRLSELEIDLSDRPGQLARLTAAVAEAGANIIEVVHQRVFTDMPAKSLVIHLVVETRDRTHLETTIARIRAAGMPVSMPARRGPRWREDDSG